MHRDFRWFLFFRFLVLNVFLGGLTGIAWINGWIQELYAADSTFVTEIILAVFFAGFCLCAWKIFFTSVELNRVKERDLSRRSRFKEHREAVQSSGTAGRADLAEALKVKLFSRIGVVSWIAGSLTVLGLVGTVIGFQLAMQGVDPSNAGLIEHATQMVATLASGVGVALSTTLVGAILNLYLYLNYLILATGTAMLYTAILEANSDV